MSISIECVRIYVCVFAHVCVCMCVNCKSLHSHAGLLYIRSFDIVDAQTHRSSNLLFPPFLLTHNSQTNNITYVHTYTS